VEASAGENFRAISLCALLALRNGDIHCCVSVACILLPLFWTIVEALLFQYIRVLKLPMGWKRRRRSEFLPLRIDGESALLHRVLNFNVPPILLANEMLFFCRRTNFVMVGIDSLVAQPLYS